MMGKRILSAITVMAIMGSSVAQANIDQFLNDAVVEVQTGRTIQTDTGTLLYGGGLQMRAPTVNIQPLTITAPSVKAGCGGIDATFGALSYLNVDQIVQLLEGMMAAAPGVMFDMALNAICPSCSKTLSKLAEMANQVNGMNLDSCSLTKKSAKWLSDQVNDSLGTGSSGPDWLDSFNSNVLDRASTMLSKFSSTLNASGCSPTSKTCGARFFTSEVSQTSFLEYVMQDDMADTYFSSTELTGMIRYFIGDFVKIAPTDASGGANQGVLKFYEPQAPGLMDFAANASSKMADWKNVTEGKAAIDANTKGILEQMIGDDTAGTVYIKGANGSLQAMNYRGNIKNNFIQRLNSISGKISSRTELSSEDISFLSMFRIPVYLITNRLASMPSGDVVLDSIKDDLATMLSYEVLYEYFARVHSILAVQRQKMDETTLDKIPYKCGGDETTCGERIRDQLGYMINQAQPMMQSAYLMSSDKYNAVSEKLVQNTELLAGINQMQQYTLQRSNPKLFETYMFAKTLVTPK